MRKILGALLSLMLMAALFCVPSFAADPVTPEQDVVRVTLPTAITVTDNRDGTFVTSDTTITNNGKANVKVSGITVEPSSGWTLVDWDSLADYTATGEQFISALFYGAAVDASGAAAGESLPAIASGESTALDCDFWLSPQVDPLNQQVATAVVTIALDGNGGLAGITVDTPPDTVDYLPGDDFDPTGMEVTAHYYDGSTADVTDYVAVEDGTDLVLGQDTVTVTYTEDDTTVETAVDITVMQSISVIVTDYTGGSATITEPADGWVVGENDLVISCNTACVVGLIRGGVLTELSCVSQPDGSYLFIVDAMDKDEIVVAIRGDADLDGGIDFADATTINQYLLGMYEFDDLKMLTADADLDGGIDFADATSVNQYLLGMYTIRWNLLDGLNTILLPEAIEVTVLDETEGAAVVTAPEEGWVTGENTFTVTCAEPAAVYLVPADGEAVKLMGETLDETTTRYTVELAEGDSIRVTLAEAEPAHVPIEVTILDETEGAIIVTAPEAGWMTGENIFTVSSTEPVAVHRVSAAGEAVELMGDTLDETTTLYTVELAEGDSIRVAFAETEPVPETIEVNVLDETGGAAVLTGPDAGWVAGENTFTVSSAEAVSVYHVAADTTVTELTGEAMDETTTLYTVTMADGDSIRMELTATEPELPEEQLPEEQLPVEGAPGDPENQTPEAGTEPSDPVSGAPAEEEPPVEEAPPVEEETPEEDTPVEAPEAEGTDTVPEPGAPVGEPETEDTDTVTESGAPDTSDESAPDASDEAGEGLQTGEPSPAGEENTVEDVQAGGAETEPAMLPDDETDEAGALAA